jgi:hypothetical protein
MKLIAIIEGQRYIGKATELDEHQIGETLARMLDEMQIIQLPLVGGRVLVIPPELASMTTFIIEPNEQF